MGYGEILSVDKNRRRCMDNEYRIKTQYLKKKKRKEKKVPTDKLSPQTNKNTGCSEKAFRHTKYMNLENTENVILSLVKRPKK